MTSYALDEQLEASQRMPARALHTEKVYSEGNARSNYLSVSAGRTLPGMPKSRSESTVKPKPKSSAKAGAKARAKARSISGRTPTSQRLQALRESLEPKVSQQMVADRLGEIQMWVSRREQGTPEPTVEDAIRIVEALGYAAALVIVQREQGELLARLASVDTDSATVALRLLRALPYLGEEARTLLKGMLELGESKAAQVTDL